MNTDEFVGWVLENAGRVKEYKKGGDGSGGLCDCIGLVIGAWRLSGNTWAWTHGSNYTARYLVRGLAADQPLRRGDLVFKAREPGEKYYDLPDTYKGHHDKRDYYHVGVVTCTAPLVIIHCTSTPGGIKKDTTRGNWKYSGQFVKLKTEEIMSAYQATVYAATGEKVNMRKGPGTVYDIVARVPVGAKVDISATTTSGWAKIKYGTREGYMSTDYLRDLEETQEANTDSPQDTTHTETERQAIERLLDTAQKCIVEAVRLLNAGKESEG